MKHILAATLSLIAGSAVADEFHDAMTGYYTSFISGWMNDQVLVSAIMAQNTQTASYSQSEIDTLDQTWRGFVGIDDAPIIAPVLNNAAADFLRQQAAASGGIITEAFIMDARGLNVAVSTPTSDYWQGDEEKFTATFPLGSSAVHYGEPELDASTQEIQGQISVTVTDPETGQPVGALTVGVSLTELTLP